MELNDEQEWDIESIKRYEKLLMFEAEYPCRQLDLFGDDNWLVSLEDKNKGQLSSILTVYSLPPRLKLSNHKQTALSQHFDLKIIAGTFCKNFTTEIATVRNADYLFASEEKAEEIIIFRLNTTCSDKLIMSGVLRCDGLMNPRLAGNNDTVIATTSSDQRISFIDIKSKSEIITRKWSGESCKCLRSLFLNHHLSLVYSSDQAEAIIYDMRQPQPSNKYLGGNGDFGLWAAGSSFEEGSKTESNHVGFVSHSGSCNFFDLRNIEKPICQINLGSRLPSCLETVEQSLEPKVTMNPLNDRLSCVSGLDSRVHVIDTGIGSVIFTHDAHEHTESAPTSDTRTTSHLHYVLGGETALISSADNSSITCWSYNKNM